MKSKKLVWLVALILVSALLFSACGQGAANQDNNEQATSSAAPTVSEATPTEETGPIFKEKMTLKLLLQNNPEIEYGNHMSVFREMERVTNVHLDFELLPKTDGVERFRAAMAAREPFDIVSYTLRSELEKYGQEGVYIPLQDLVKEHAPNIKNAFDNPLPNDSLPYSMNVWSELTAPDGNMYALPIISAANAIGRVYAIRQDWLDSLSLKTPETPDELYTVLKAFKENDPNGNNLQDEIPLGAQNSKYQDIMPLINGFGAHLFLYIDKKDDTIKFGPVEQVWKTGMTFINKLYNEGLLDKDYLNSKKDKWSAMVAANQLGMMYVWPMSGIGSANNELAKIDENFRFVSMLPMKAPDGSRYTDTYTAGNIVTPRLAITSMNKNPIDTIKYLDFLYSDAGTTLFSYGVEGQHYNVVDGKIVISDYIVNNTAGLSADRIRKIEGINPMFLPFMIGWESQFQIMEKNSPFVVDAWTMYRESGTVEKPMPTLHFTDAELEKGPTAMKEIIAYVTEKYNPFAVGEEPLDKHDDFVAQIKKMGLDDALKIYNDAYLRYKEYSK